MCLFQRSINNIYGLYCYLSILSSMSPISTLNNVWENLCRLLLWNLDLFMLSNDILTHSWRSIGVLLIIPPVRCPHSLNNCCETMSAACPKNTGPLLPKPRIEPDLQNNAPQTELFQSQRLREGIGSVLESMSCSHRTLTPHSGPDFST